MLNVVVCVVVSNLLVMSHCILKKDFEWNEIINNKYSWFCLKIYRYVYKTHKDLNLNTLKGHSS